MHEQRVQTLKDQVAAALADRRALAIRGGGTRGSRVDDPAREGDALLELGSLSGVLAWEPDERVVTVAAGTTLMELEATLATRRQRLLGEPWLPSPRSTVAGAVAAGLSGPGRPWLGSVSDAVLGLRLLTAPGGRLVDGRFGGRVIKNVAGFDVSRLQVGACGVLGVILELHLRVAPVAGADCCLVADTGTRDGIERLRTLEPPAWPVTGAVLEQGRLHLRLEGEPAVLSAARTALGSNFREEDPLWWQRLRAGLIPFDPVGEGLSSGPVWRVCTPRGCLPLAIEGDCLIDWGGALQWWRPAAGIADEDIVAAARAAGAVAQPLATAPFASLAPSELALHRALKRQLDPGNCFNAALLDVAPTAWAA
jgi:glycolate oxidase FAD binding subunit